MFPGGIDQWHEICLLTESSDSKMQNNSPDHTVSFSFDYSVTDSAVLLLSVDKQTSVMGMELLVV